ncbi:hypothetical protein [Rothia mucilaginosa]
METMACGSVDYERVRASWRYERTGAVWRMQARRAWESEINSPMFDPMAGAQATVLIADNRTEYEQSSYGLRHWSHCRAQEALLSLGAEIAARWARVFLGSRCAFAFKIEEDVEGIVFGGEEVLDATLDGSVPRIMLCDDADSARILERYRRAAALASCLEMGKVEHLFLERFDTTTRSWAIEEAAMLTTWEVLNGFEGWMEDCDKAREQVQAWLDGGRDPGPVTLFDIAHPEGLTLEDAITQVQDMAQSFHPSAQVHTVFFTDSKFEEWNRDMQVFLSNHGHHLPSPTVRAFCIWTSRYAPLTSHMQDKLKNRQVDELAAAAQNFAWVCPVIEDAAVMDAWAQYEAHLTQNA